jgi:hypothetical protein
VNAHVFSEDAVQIAIAALLAMVVIASFIHAKHEVRKAWRRLREELRELGRGKWGLKIRRCTAAVAYILVISSHVPWYFYELLARAFWHGVTTV